MYIPILNVLAFAVNLSNPGLVTMGVIGLLLIVPFAFGFTVYYFQPVPSPKSVMARSDTRADVFNMVTKTLVTFLAVWLPSFPYLSSIILFVCGSINTFLIAKYLPYYRYEFNCFKLSINALLAFTGIVGIGAAFGFGTYFQSSYTALGEELAIFYFVFSPVLIACIVVGFRFYYYRRTRMVMTKLKNIDQVGDTPEDYILALNKIEFVNPLEVELQTRFLKETATIKKSKIYGQDDEFVYDKVDLNIATAIYERAVEQFGENPTMYALKALFYGVYRHDFVEWRVLLEKAQDYEPSFSQSLLILQAMTSRDQAHRKMKNGSDFDTSDLLDIQNSLRVAKRYGKYVKNYASELWKMMLTNKVDPVRVQRLISKMYLNEKAAGDLFDSTLRKYPESVSVASAYASFLEVNL